MLKTFFVAALVLAAGAAQAAVQQNALTVNAPAAARHSVTPPVRLAQLQPDDMLDNVTPNYGLDWAYFC